MPKSMFGTVRMKTKDAQAVARNLGRPDSGLKWLDDVNKDRFDLGEPEIVIDQNAAPHVEKPPRRIIPKADQIETIVSAENALEIPMRHVALSLVAESGLTLAEIANHLPTLNEAVREWAITADQSAAANTDISSGEPVWMGIDYANQPDLCVQAPDRFVAYMVDGTTKTGGPAEYLALTGQSGSTAPTEQTVDAAAAEFAADMAPAANHSGEQAGLGAFVKTERDGTLFLAYDSDLHQLKSARLALHMGVIRRRSAIREAEEDILLIREQLGWINRRIDRLSRKKP